MGWEWKGNSRSYCHKNLVFPSSLTCHPTPPHPTTFSAHYGESVGLLVPVVTDLCVAGNFAEIDGTVDNKYPWTVQCPPPPLPSPTFLVNLIFIAISMI